VAPLLPSARLTRRDGGPVQGLTKKLTGGVYLRSDTGFCHAPNLIMSATSTALFPSPAAPMQACPFQGASLAVVASAELQASDQLVLPKHQRMVTQRADNEDGQAELRLFYDDKEISFDEPELFTFGETLARTPRFAAGDALHWGSPGDWPRVRELLQQLLEEGVLRHADEAQADERVLGDAGVQPSPLAPAQTDRARSWHECPGLMAELTGRPLDIGYLELVVPIFRVAHMSLDSEGRQVGESNAFPAVLRVDVPTRWRTCIYSGSRYLDDKPMNVSALKSMRAHWAPMMAMLLKLRQAYLARCPQARAGWTVGHLERLSTAVLALPAYQLMRREQRVENGQLHPVLSSMFRVTDGLRMTMHHMLFIPFGEPTRKPNTPMSSAEVHAYAERAFSLHSDHGVCAGPKVMIDEFLSVLIDGQLPRDGLPEVLDAELQAAVADIEPALDYAMLGLQAYAAVFSLWPMSMRCYEELHSIAQAWVEAEPTPAVLALQRWLQPLITRLRNSTHLATEAWRADREVVYGDMYAQCELAWRGELPPRSLSALLTPAALPAHSAATRALRAALQRQVGEASSLVQQRCRHDWLACLQRYLTQAQAVVQVACAVQAHTNRLLGRATPTQRFCATDIDIYVQLVGSTDGRVPFLLDELQTLCGVRIRIDADAIDIEDQQVPA
jgi:hypothetical protein